MTFKLDQITDVATIGGFLEIYIAGEWARSPAIPPKGLTAEWIAKECLDAQQVARRNAQGATA